MPGEWGPKRPGSQEQDAKMTREQGAEENNLGSMEHRAIKSWWFISYIFFGGWGPPLRGLIIPFKAIIIWRAVCKINYLIVSL